MSNGINDKPVEYEDFKVATIEANRIAQQANEMRFTTKDFARGFELGMYEAREIFMRLQQSESNDN